MPEPSLYYPLRKLDDQCEVWECTSPSSIAVVFVHGWTGDFHETWTWKETRKGLKRLKFWGSQKPKHLVSDFLVHESCLGADYYSFAHPAGFFDIVGVQKVADALRTFIDLNVVGPRSTRQIVLISHSLGGLVCRQVVVDYLKTEVSKKADIIGLMMMGTRNLGTEVARVAARFLPSRSSQDMKPWSDYLEHRSAPPGPPSVPVPGTTLRD